jgi:hypothetical protein
MSQTSWNPYDAQTLSVESNRGRDHRRWFGEITIVWSHWRKLPAGQIDSADTILSRVKQALNFLPPHRCDCAAKTDKIASEMDDERGATGITGRRE